MDLVLLALRLVHIGSGILWVGGAALFFFYIEPSINKLGPDAQKFVDELINRRKAPIYFAGVAILAVLSGIVLIWRDSDGFQASWITSPTGLGFTIGGLAALIAGLGGNLLIPRTLGQLSAAGAEMSAGGGPPSPELVGRFHAIQERLRLIGLVDIVLLAIAVVGMAVARYLA